MVDLVRAGRTIPSLAAEYGVSYSAIRKWVQDADRAATRNLDGVAPGDQTELQRLRARRASAESRMRDSLRRSSEAMPSRVEPTERRGSKRIWLSEASPSAVSESHESCGSSPSRELLVERSKRRPCAMTRRNLPSIWWTATSRR